MWRAVRWLALLCMILAGVLVFNARRLPSQSRQMPGVSSQRADLLAGVDTDKVAHILAEFLAMPDLKPKPFVRLHEILEEEFPRAHQVMERETINEFSLLYRWPGENEDLDPVLFMAHLDVVPVEEKTLKTWSHPPTEAIVADGYVWGRGALDVKCGVIGIMAAAEILAESGFQPQRTIYLAFGHDEEIGGEKGNAVIAKTLKDRGIRLFFVLDEGGAISEGIISGLPKPLALIATAEKRPVYLELTATGAGGHGSMPSENSSIPVLARAIGRIYERPMPVDLHPATATLLDFLGPEMSFTKRLAIGNRWLFEGLIVDQFTNKPSTDALVRSTMGPTQVRTESAPNQIPPHAWASVNGRLLPGENPGQMVRHLEMLMKSEPELDVTCRVFRSRPENHVSSSDNRQFEMIQHTVHEVFPDVIVAAGLTPVATDSGWYNEVTDSIYRFIPMRLTGEDLERIHGIDERIAVDNLAEIVAFYQRLISNVQK